MASKYLVSAIAVSASLSISTSISVPVPISVEPSASWYEYLIYDWVHKFNRFERISNARFRDGNDGPWSSFVFQIGSPPQAIRLLPSTSTSAVLAMIPQTCSNQVPGSCSKARGTFLNISASSTWEKLGAFNIANYAGQFLGYGGGAEYGLDNITLGWPGGGGIGLTDQTIGGCGSGDYYTGIFGLSSEPNNFTDVNAPKPSLLGSMKEQHLVSSSSYAYTAGAYYRD